MIEPNLINDLPDMIQLAIMSINKPPKAVALELNCSISAIYQALHGKRTLPAKKMRKFAESCECYEPKRVKCEDCIVGLCGDVLVLDSYHLDVELDEIFEYCPKCGTQIEVK